MKDIGKMSVEELEREKEDITRTINALPLKLGFNLSRRMAKVIGELERRRR